MSLPSTYLVPGVYSEISILPSALPSVASRVLVVAIKSAAGTATSGTPVQVQSATEADALAGVGSQAALMLRAALEQATRQTGQRDGSLSYAAPELWLQAIAAPAGTAATQTLTVAVTTSAAGTIELAIDGRSISVLVDAGATASAIATAIRDAIATKVQVLPATATVAGAVVTCTATAAGVWGNDITYQVLSVPSGVTVTAAVGVAGAGVVDVTASLDATLSSDYAMIALGNHAAADVADAIAHYNVASNYLNQRYRTIVIAEKGSLGTATALALGGNHEAVVVVTCEGAPSLPGELAACFAVRAAGQLDQAGNVVPNVNLNDAEIYLPPPAASVSYDGTEKQSALLSGCTPLVRSTDGTSLVIVRAVTTATLRDGGFVFDSYDLAIPRTRHAVARARADSVRARVKKGAGGAAALASARDAILAADRALEARNPPVIQNVEGLKSRYVVSFSASAPGRIESQCPFTPVAPVSQVVIDNQQEL